MTKSDIKNIRLLHQKKYRDEHGLFIAEGPKVVNELLNSKYKAKEIFATTEYETNNSKHKIQIVNANELEEISSLTTPNKVLGIFEIPLQTSPKFGTFEKLNHNLILALDDIRDPGNMGTIIRIADWFGIKNIICSETCVDVYNLKVIQATMGSIARVEIHSMNLDSFFSEIKNGKTKINIYGAVMNGKNIYSEKLSDKGIILIGNESKGISDNLLGFVSHKISIPNFGKADSLNAAIATAIICSEFKRR